MAVSISTIFCDPERQIRKSVRGFLERGMKIAADAPWRVMLIAAIYGTFTVEYESYSIIMVFSQVQLNR
jgi:hypothetical protein